MRVQLMARRKVWFSISGALVLVSLLLLVLRGLNLGVEFTGGSLLDLTFERPVGTREVRRMLEEFGLGGAIIQRDVREPRRVFVRVPPLDGEERKRLMTALQESISPLLSDEVRTVTPIISRELVRNAAIALTLASAAMIVYITIRFEYKFALVAIAALLHDVIVTLGLFSFLQVEVGAPFVAALLTIVGYSINDTIVVFDKIRENLRGTRKSVWTVVDESVNQVMMRSINTSATTGLAILAILLFGGKTTREFALALLAGGGAGTYSSIFLASPLWAVWKQREERVGWRRLRRSRRRR